MKYKQLIYLFLVVIFLFKQHTSFSQEKIVAKGDVWQYYDNGPLPNNWYYNLNYNSWKTGVTPIGYGDKKIKTEIFFGNNPKKKDAAKYFRKTITIDSIKKFVAFEMIIKRDDGIVVYVNKNEIYRNNMPDNIITGNTLALDMINGEKESAEHTKIISSKYFVSGKNTISISVHQYDLTSSDCILNFELFGYTNFKSLNNALNSVISNTTNQEISIFDLKNQLVTEKIELELNIVKNTNENLKFIVFIIGFLLITGLIGYYILVTNQNKKDKLTNETIINLKKENIDKEKEMITISTKLLHNRQNLKELKADIRGIKTDDKAMIKSLINQIDFSLERDDDWDNLQKHFEAVHNGFYDKLIQKHATLTETELRHCMFIKMHMQTKEIARVLLIDPRSVQTSRYRIKKKMELDENVDLRVYLLSIS